MVGQRGLSARSTPLHHSSIFRRLGGRRKFCGIELLIGVDDSAAVWVVVGISHGRRSFRLKQKSALGDYRQISVADCLFFGVAKRSSRFTSADSEGCLPVFRQILLTRSCASL